MRRVLLIGLAILIALVVLARAATLAYLRGSLPELDGNVAVSGISGPVDIIRDRDAVTHVFAATRLDTFYGLGYAHAQDRLWQMEFQRRVGHARLSEVFGAATIATDRFLRTLGIGRAARSAWDALPAGTKNDVNAYVAGVNAFISTHHGRRLPLEFTVLRYEPEPWSGPDVIAWVKMMAWDLSKNYSIELLRHDLMEAIGAARVADLFQPYPAGGLTILSARDMPWTAPKAGRKPTADVVQDFRPADGAARQGSWLEAFAATPLPGGGALGSNNWVVDGTMTASGKPLLANDPHLGAQIPSLWYLAHLSAGDFDVIGATLPGAPAIAIGRNRFIAWGETNVMADVQDLFRERLDPSGTSAEFRGAREPLRIVKETIAVKGAAPIDIDGPDLAPRPAHLGRHQRQQRRLDADPARGSHRTARVQMDRARSRGHDDRRLPRPEPGAQLDGIHHRPARFRRARAELRLRRRRRAHRLLRAGASSRARGRKRLDARRGMDGRGRMDRLDPLRSAAARVRSARSLHRHGQREAGATRVPVRDQRRVDRAVPGATHRRSPETEDGPHARRLRVDAVGHVVAPRAGAAADPVRPHPSQGRPRTAGRDDAAAVGP